MHDNTVKQHYTRTHSHHSSIYRHAVSDEINVIIQAISNT